jgi:trimeric autotransporter adhesin
VGVGTTSPSYTLQVNGSVAGVGAYNNVSDARYKTNITRLTHALDKIMALRGVEYDWRSNAYPQMKFDNGAQLGFVAQEIKEVLPEVVSQDAQGYYSIAYSKVIPVLVEAIKDQQREVESMRLSGHV